jgi:hypothetical protein
MKKYAFTLFAAVQLGSALLLAACDAQGPCDRAYAGSKDSVKRACRRGAEEIAPATKGADGKADIKAADAKCAELYARPERYLDNAEGCFVLADPDRDVRDLYNACHYGATGYLVAVEGQDPVVIQNEGCVQISGPGGTRCY